MLISARAPVGSPLVHVTALDADGAAHALGDLRPSASWDTFAFNAAGLGGQTVRLVLDPVMGRRTPSIFARVGESEQVAAGMTLVRGAARRAAGLPAGALLTAGAGPFELRTALFRLASDAATISVWIRGIGGLAAHRLAERRQARRSALRSRARPGAPCACRWSPCAGSA